MPPWLVTLLLLSAGPGGGGQERAAREVLARHCARQAADPHDPWALAHGVLAFGAGFRAADGRHAVDAIVAEHLRRDEDGRLRFAPHAPDGTPVEPHPDLQLRTLARAGVPLGRTFRTREGPVALGALVEDAKRAFRPPPPGGETWGEAAWTLGALAEVLEPGARFRNDAGEEVDFDRVMDGALEALEAASAELGRGMDEGRPRVKKDKRGVWAQPCGGLHLAQALVTWARHPAVRVRWGRRFLRQVDILLYRVRSESSQYEEALRELPRHRLLVLAQMLKFHGHLLETVRMLERTGWRPTGHQRATIALARAQLAAAAQGLMELHALEPAGPPGAGPQTRLDLAGDACHAVAGL